MTGAAGVGSKDVLSGSRANGFLFLRASSPLSILTGRFRFCGGLGLTAKPPQLLRGEIHINDGFLTSETLAT